MKKRKAKEPTGGAKRKASLLTDLLVHIGELETRVDRYHKVNEEEFDCIAESSIKYNDAVREIEARLDSLEAAIETEPTSAPNEEVYAQQIRDFEKKWHGPKASAPNDYLNSGSYEDLRNMYGRQSAPVLRDALGDGGSLRIEKPTWRDRVAAFFGRVGR